MNKKIIKMADKLLEIAEKLLKIGREEISDVANSKKGIRLDDLELKTYTVFEEKYHIKAEKFYQRDFTYLTLEDARRKFQSLVDEYKAKCDEIYDDSPDFFYCKTGNWEIIVSYSETWDDLKAYLWFNTMLTDIHIIDLEVGFEEGWETIESLKELIADIGNINPNEVVLRIKGGDEL